MNVLSCTVGLTLVSVPAMQMLQLWRSGSPRQGVRPAPPAKEMPLLPEHHPHGGSVSLQGLVQLTGPTDLPRVPGPRGGGPQQLLSPGGKLLSRGRAATPRAVLPAPPEEALKRCFAGARRRGRRRAAFDSQHTTKG